MKAEIEVENINCSGCAATIEKALKNISGVEAVRVEIKDKLVDVDYSDRFVLEAIKEKLMSLGYPESGSVHGITKATTKAKSLVSCAVGKLS